ncbi:hypothetical protein POL68_10290 [Stigmatella sp. ncwal1]|uniref:Zinc ribbon domain-containing protein n=1 Tax=Stigmatella ashevillensis TaxID=2995309 RepID=A0ABT5D5B1_9BACT|nr:hypothetical protein [Stigmatella ashevillena]MDC0708854.1 hypothetical protein [Stigmatella ashevillena]
MGDCLLEGALALNCPGCGTQVADGTSICPKCDYIIDTSFLSSDPPPGSQDDDDEVTGAGADPRQAAPPPRPARRASTSASTGRVPTHARSGGAASVGRTGSRPAAGARASAPSKPATEDSTQIKNVKDIAPSRAPPRPASRPPSRSVPAARRAPAASPPEAELDDAEPRKALLPPSQPSDERAYNHTGRIVAPEEVISDARAFVDELTRSDKITFAGAAAIIISCFLPWKETAEDGEILGLLSIGAVALVGAVAIIAAIAVRVRRTMPSLHPLAPWVLQLGVSIFCIFFTLIAIRLASDSTVVASPIGNQMVENSSASLGVFLALLGAIGALTGSLMGLKERS